MAGTDRVQLLGSRLSTGSDGQLTAAKKVVLPVTARQGAVSGGVAARVVTGVEQSAGKVVNELVPVHHQALMQQL